MNYGLRIILSSSIIVTSFYVTVYYKKYSIGENPTPIQAQPYLFDHYQTTHTPLSLVLA